MCFILSSFYHIGLVSLTNTLFVDSSWFLSIFIIMDKLLHIRLDIIGNNLFYLHIWLDIIGNNM